MTNKVAAVWTRVSTERQADTKWQFRKSEKDMYGICRKSCYSYKKSIMAVRMRVQKLKVNYTVKMIAEVARDKENKYNSCLFI